MAYLPATDQLHARTARAGRIPGGEWTGTHGAEPLGGLGPLGTIRREHVYHAHTRRARLCHQAHELPRACADLQAGDSQLPRAADPLRGVRKGAPLRTVRRAAWPDAGARLYSR